MRYFTCPEKHGLFVKRLQVKLDKDAPPAVVEAKRSRDNEMKPPSKLPSFEDKKISSAVAAPVEEGSSTPDQVTAQPLPPPEMPIPEVLNNNANEASGNQESPTSLESEVQRERDDQNAVELQFLRLKIHDLELERNAHLTQANLLQEYDAKIKEQEEILRRKDIQIGELEKRIIGLADEIDREKQNSTQEIRSLKGMLEQAKSTGDSDQTKKYYLMFFSLNLS